MRIVLTNAGKKEIIIDEIENPPYKNYVSEEKNKYLPKFPITSKHIEKNKFQTKQSSLLNINNLSEKRMLTEGSVIDQSKLLRKSTSIKVPKLFEFNGDKINNLKIINLKSLKKVIPKELNNLYSSSRDKNENVFDIEKINNKIEIKHLDNGFSLPTIKRSFALKDILADKNCKNLNKKVLKKQISKNENNLINYLKMDKTIKPSFIEKLNKADNDRLIKLDKICQKYFNEKKRNDLLQQNIQDKIKLEYSNDSKYCKENLLNLQKNIQGCKKIYKSYFTSHYIKDIK